MPFALLVSASLLGGLLTAAGAEGDSRRMQRDVHIAENILRALLDTPNHMTPLPPATGPRVRGVHIEDYGVVFLAEGPPSDRRIVEHMKRQWVDEQGRQHLVETRRGTPDRLGDETDPVRAALSEFLSEYAGAIDGLSIGYRTVKATKDDKGQRLLSEVELWEVSLVTFPMLAQARVGAKGQVPEADILRELTEVFADSRRMLARN